MFKACDELQAKLNGIFGSSMSKYLVLSSSVHHNV